MVYGRTNLFPGHVSLPDLQSPWDPTDVVTLYPGLVPRWWCDVELVGAGWSLAAHRAILSARCTYFRDLLQRYPP